MEIPKKLLEELREKIKDLPEEKQREIEEEFINFYKKFLIDPGEPVGIIASQSIAEPTTQMILKSFHFVGGGFESKASLGLPRLLEIADARKKVKNKVTKIYLIEEYKKDYQKAYEVALRIKEVVLEDLTSEIALDIFENKIIISLDEKKLEKNNLSEEEVYNILKKKLKKYKVELEGGNIVIFAEKIKSKDLYLLKNNIKKIHIKGIPGIKDVTIKREDEEYVIYASGSNLMELMKIPEIDYRKIYTNDIKEIEKVFGIEAAREAIFRELVKLYAEQGFKVDPRHFALLADVLTWHGEYLGINRYGLQSEKASTLSKASFEVPIRILMTAALRGEEDPVSSSIDNLIMNQVIPLGTGLYDIYYKGEMNKKVS